MTATLIHQRTTRTTDKKGNRKANCTIFYYKLDATATITGVHKRQQSGEVIRVAHTTDTPGGGMKTLVRFVRTPIPEILAKGDGALSPDLCSTVLFKAVNVHMPPKDALREIGITVVDPPPPPSRLTEIINQLNHLTQ